MRPPLVRMALFVVALATALGAPLSLTAQTTGSVRGKVVESGSLRPLSGVQVSIPGTGRGALTNAAGDYLLVGVPTGTHAVRAQMIGFTESTQDVTVATGEAARADFQLSQSAIELDALVVTGTPGATQKRAIGNSVTTVSAEAVTGIAPISNVTQLLQARAPGLSITPGAGTSGTAAQIRIRGQSSLGGSQIPVFIVDGIRISNVQSGYSTSGQSRNPLDFINPDDIESIEVIKGPAAATLYGAEAANGVIQIITKKGKKGQQELQWNLKAEYGQIDWDIETPTNWTLCTNARVRTSGSGAVASFPGCAGIDTTLAAGDERRMISANLLQEPGALRSGDLMNYSLSARGGGDRYSFFVSGDYLDETGVQYNNETGRKSARANFTFTPTDVLDFSVNMSYGRTDARLPQNDNSSNGVLRNAIRGVPGRLGNYGIGWIGLSPAEANIYNNTTRADRFVSGATANWAPFEWFKSRATVGVDHNVSVATIFYPIWRGTAPPPFGVDNGSGAIYQYTPERRSYTMDYAGTISTGLPFGGDVTSDFSFGAQANVRQFEWTEGEGIGLVTNDVRLIGTAATTRADSDVEEQTSLGFFVQEQVGFANKLFVTGALRVDDNSAFGQDFSTVIYPKLSASYVISEEDFFNVPNVDNLRLRAAWGQAGNSPEPFSADRTYGGATLTEADGTTAPALRSTAYGNPNLKAETGSEIEAGFEASLFDGRAGVDFTYYNKRTFDALIPIPVPPSSGFGGEGFDGTTFRTRLENAGEIANSGIELSVFGTPVQRPNFSWDARIGVSTNHNELVDLGGLEPQLRGSFATTQWIKEGYPLGSYFGIKAQRNADGTFVKDSQGRGILSTDTVYIGSSTPTREASLSNTLTFFGNLRLYVFADYKGGGYMWNAGEFIRYSNSVSKIGANPALDPEAFAERRSGSTLPFVTKSDFVKLREVAVSYTVPQSLSTRVGTDELTVTLSGRNLAMWTDYLGMDPEVNFSGIPGPGFGSVDRSDYMSVPMLRRFQASVNVRF